MIAPLMSTSRALSYQLFSARTRFVSSVTEIVGSVRDGIDDSKPNVHVYLLSNIRLPLMK